MSEYIPITTDLRLLVGCFTAKLTDFERDKFNQLCDAIDSVHAALEAEHEKAMNRAGQLLDDAEKERDYNYANWQECKQKVLQGNITFDELERENESLKAELDRARGEWDFWESTHVELPKDMNGEPVRIGDVMEWSDGTTFEVIGIGDGTLFYVETDENGSSSIEWTSCELKRHHKPDTFASIIEDAIGDRIEDRAEFDKELDALVARCKALAGDAE